MHEWVFILIYVALQMGITIYISRFVKSEGDFFLAGRSIPTWALAFSVFATWFGAETCIGSSASVFQSGLSGSKAEPFGYTICLILVALVVAPKIWNQKYFTLGDLFADKIGKSTEKIAVWILLPSSLIWGAAQVRAFGSVLSLSADIPVQTGVLVATGFVIFYTFVGGLLGDIISDVVQGTVLALSLLAILVLIMLDIDVAATVSSIPAERLNLLSDDGPIWQRIDSWLIPIAGSIVTQELVARILAARNPQVARNSSLAGAGVYFIFGSIPILLGLLMWNADLKLADAEQFLPTIAKQHLSPFFYMVFIGALISAILSTVDSIFLALSALVSHNLVVPYLQLKSEKAKLLSARCVVVVVGLIAAVIALYAESVYEMVELASSFGTTGILVVTLGALYKEKPSVWISNVTLIFGLVLSIFFEFILSVPGGFVLNLILVTIFYISTSYLAGIQLRSRAKLE